MSRFFRFDSKKCEMFQIYLLFLGLNTFNMNKYITFFLITLSLVMSCTNRGSSAKVEQKASESEDSLVQEYELDTIIHLDLTKDYKPLSLNLKDIATVRYIPLETNDDFLCDGGIYFFSDSLIIYFNYNSNADILFFDGEGRGKYKINKKGNSGEEYIGLTDGNFDPKTNELFVNDKHRRRYLVYDVRGNYKRTISYLSAGRMYGGTAFWGKDKLLVTDAKSNKPFSVISRKDGSILKTLPIRSKKTMIDTWILIPLDQGVRPVYLSNPSYIKYNDEFIVGMAVSDTVYKMDSNYNVRPVLVKTPPIGDEEEPYFVYSMLETKRYCFIRTAKKSYNKETDEAFPSEYFIYDKKDNTIYKQQITYEDMGSSIDIRMGGSNTIKNGVLIRNMEAAELIEANGRGALHGDLKKIADSLDEEDNPVLMIVEFK